MELAVSSAGELFVFLERDAGFFGMGRHYNGRKRSPSSHSQAVDKGASGAFKRVKRRS